MQTSRQHRVSKSSGIRRALLWVLFGTVMAGSVFAQHALYVSDGEHAMRLVRKVDNRAPYILDHGKFTLPAPYDSASGTLSRRYRLNAADEFLPSFVSVRIIKADFSHLNMGSVRRLDRQFEFTAAFSSDFRLSDLFFVLEFDTTDLERKCYVQEVPAKDLQQARAISIDVPLPSAGTNDKYELHVFSGGLEVFHSAMPRPMIEAALQKMAAKRIKDAHDSGPKPLTGPMPRYPETLRGSKTTGGAVIACTIAPSGQPTELSVKSATHPAFGEAALAVMSQWWFVPAVANGQPVAAKAELPFEFAPPKS